MGLIEDTTSKVTEADSPASVMPTHAGIHGSVQISTANRGWWACAHQDGESEVSMGHSQGPLL